MSIEKKRECDGACCKAAPLRPKGDDCFFRDPEMADRGCKILADPTLKDDLTPKEAKRFKDACEDWPETATKDNQGSWGGCCWGWQDG